MEMTDITSNVIEKTTALYLLFSVGKNVYGINSEYVHGIETLGEVTSISNSKPIIRGGVLYQNNFIPLIDMRKLFGLDSQIDEFEKTVNPEQRKKDHDNWVSTLEKSVLNHTEFTLTDDPHLCALGKWYYSFKTESSTLKHQLSTIEAPHEAVHATAKKVKELMKSNKQEEALSEINEMRNTHYRTTINILSSLRDIVSKSFKELYIVINIGDSTKGIIVDSIVGIEDLCDISPIPDTLTDSNYIKTMGQREEDNSVVFILNNLP